VSFFKSEQRSLDQRLAAVDGGASLEKTEKVGYVCSVQRGGRVVVAAADFCFRFRCGSCGSDRRDGEAMMAADAASNEEGAEDADDDKNVDAAEEEEEEEEEDAAALNPEGVKWARSASQCLTTSSLDLWGECNKKRPANHGTIDNTCRAW
jgi:hypothetical protein